MRPGERVDLIKRVADSLARTSWDHVDLVLRQFGLPWSREWQGELEGYVLHHLQRGEDAQLVELHAYLFPEPVERAVETDRWTPSHFRLFMSHVHDDKALVSAVKSHLSRYGVDSFVAHEDIEPTKQWVTEIETALDTCHALAAFLTRTFHESKWTDQELGYCLHRRVLIVPIKLGVDPYGFVARYQAFTGQGKTAEEIAGALVDILFVHELTAREMAAAVVNYFAASNSYEATRSRVALLDRITAWTPELLQRVETAARENSQIRECYYMPERIRALVRRHSGRE
jgi:TIR domain